MSATKLTTKTVTLARTQGPHRLYRRSTAVPRRPAADDTSETIRGPVGGNAWRSKLTRSSSPSSSHVGGSRILTTATAVPRGARPGADRVRRPAARSAQHAGAAEKPPTLTGQANPADTGHHRVSPAWSYGHAVDVAHMPADHAAVCPYGPRRGAAAAWAEIVRRAERGEPVPVIAHDDHIADIVPSGELDRLRETIEVLSVTELLRDLRVTGPVAGNPRRLGKPLDAAL